MHTIVHVACATQVGRDQRNMTGEIFSAVIDCAVDVLSTFYSEPVATWAVCWWFSWSDRYSQVLQA